MNLNGLKIDQCCPLCMTSHAFVHWSSFRDAFVSLTTRSFQCPLCLTSIQGVDKFALHLVSHDLRNKMQVQEMLMTQAYSKPPDPTQELVVTHPPTLMTLEPAQQLSYQQVLKKPLQRKPVIVAPPPLTSATTEEIPQLSIKEPAPAAMDVGALNKPKDALDELLQDFTEFVKQEDKGGGGPASEDPAYMPFSHPGSMHADAEDSKKLLLKNQNLLDGGDCIWKGSSPSGGVGPQYDNFSPESGPKSGGGKKKNSGSRSDRSEASVHCDMCGWNFDNEKFLQLHKVLMHSPHRTSRLLPLTEPPDESSHFNSLRLKNEFRCKECPHLMFKTGEDYTNHLKDTHNDQRHVCNVCGKLFKLRGSLLVHQRVVHNPIGEDRSFQCRVCSRKFSNKYRRDHHEKRHGVDALEEAEITPGDTLPPSNESFPPSLSDYGAVMHRCDGCQASFHSEAELVVHSADCHSVDPDSLLFKDKPSPLVPQPSPQSVTEGSFACGICDKKFKKETHLNQHLQVHEVKQWECDVCKKSFTTKYFLKKHKRLHTGETPYSCAKCGKSFTFQQSYHKHMLYHTDEKPYTCNQCGRSFKELSTLQNHERIHSGERPFACETCGKSFRQRVSYLVHRRIHTGVMPYVCEHCNKKFRYKVTQRTHKCPGKQEGSAALVGEMQLPSMSTELAGLLDQSETRKKLPNLPLEIQEDLERFRRQNRKSNKLNSSYADKHIQGGQVENSTAVSVITTPEEPQIPYPASNETEEQLNPLGQLQLLSINEANNVMNPPPPQYPNFFVGTDLDPINFL